MEHIIEFLRSMDEPEMADEVANAHNRLECYSTGITNEIIESLRSVAEKSLAELSALKTELREICAAIDDPASDLTLTTVECIKKLKTENEELRKDAEWQPIETAPKETEIFIGRFIDGKFRFGRSELIYEHANEFAGETWSGWLWSIDDCNDSIADCPTHWMPLPKPPTMAQGEHILDTQSKSSVASFDG